MTLPSADELLTGVSKHAHGSVDGIEDSENKNIDWRAVGAGLRHYLPVVSALALFFLPSPTTFVLPVI